MEITYSWRITEIKKETVNGLDGVVTHIRFDYTGTSDKTDENGEFKTATFNGAVPTLPPDSENFKTFENLTESDVIEWVKSIHPTEHMQEVISEKLNDNIPDILNSGSLPWES
jgi:hypothetical protein